MAASIGADAAVLAADKAEQRRIIAGTSERSSHPLKYSSDQRLWVSLPSGARLSHVLFALFTVMLVLATMELVAHAYEMHAYEGFCEDLARQTTITHLSQLQLGLRRCRIWVSVTVMAS